MNIDISQLSVRDIGIMLVSYPNLKMAIIGNMCRHGGSFVQTLAELMMRADDRNLTRIVEAFSDYIVKYRPQRWK